MANVKTVQIRRNLAPNAYYLDMQVNERLMQEYDVQMGKWTPNVVERETWRTLITTMVKTVSMDGTNGGEMLNIASYQYLYRVAGTTEWKDLSTIAQTNGRPQMSSYYGGGLIYLRQQANIPAGVVYEVKCVATVADEDIRCGVTVESDIYRVGCNDKTMDEIRFRLVKGQQNIIYNPEAPGPYTVEGLEKATFLQQCEFEVTKGGRAFWSDDLVVECDAIGGKSVDDEGVTLVYDFTNWNALYVESNTPPTAVPDQIGNSVYLVDKYIGVHSDTWAISHGGLFTYAAGARKMDILWKGKIRRIELQISPGTSGTTPNESWVTVDQNNKAVVEYTVNSGGLKVDVYVTNQGDSITTKGLTLTVARNLVITSMSIEGIDAEDVMHQAKGTGQRCYFFDTSMADLLGDYRIAADACYRHALQKLDAANGTVKVTMDCGSRMAGATALRLYNKDRTVLYDERVISFQRKVPQIEVSVENLPFIENKGTTTQKMRVKLFAEGHEVTEYGFYWVTKTVKKADGETGELTVTSNGRTDKGFEFTLTGTAEGTVTFEPEMKEKLMVLM